MGALMETSDMEEIRSQVKTPLRVVGRDREIRAGAHARHLVGLHGAGMDVRGVASLRIGRGYPVAQPRRIDRPALGQVAECDPHCLDCLRDREQPGGVIVGNHDRHAFRIHPLSCCAQAGSMAVAVSRTG